MIKQVTGTIKTLHCSLDFLYKSTRADQRCFGDNLPKILPTKSVLVRPLITQHQ